MRDLKPVRPLTVTQQEVVTLVREGCTLEQIADRLKIGYTMAHTHVRNISFLLPDVPENPYTLPPLRRLERWVMSQAA